MASGSFSLCLSGNSIGLPNVSVSLFCQQPLPEAPIDMIKRAAAAAAAGNKGIPPPILIQDALLDDFEIQIGKERLAYARKNCDSLLATNSDDTHGEADFSSKTELVEAWCQLYGVTWADFSTDGRQSGGVDNSLVAFVDSYLALAASQGLIWIFNEVQRLTTEWAELQLKQQTEEDSLEKEHRKLVDSLAVNSGVDTAAINFAAREHIEARERLQQHHRADTADLHRALSQRLRLGVIAKASAMRLMRSEPPRSPTASMSLVDSVPESPAIDLEGRLPSGSDVSFTSSNLRQDCFTIALGTQVRSTANVKLLAADLTDIVKSVAHVPKAQWLHNVMTMYSTEQSAVVVMVDGDLSLFNEPLSTMHSATKPVPELHFSSYADQIGETASLARKNRRTATEGESSVLEAGDFFATRHSNLSGVDVIFHLVWSASDSQQQTSRSTGSSLLDAGEITSRHPVIGGLRTLVRTCLEHDITSITVPLLLTTSTRLPESATLAWCARRAELVLKCVKGYLLEHTNNSGASSTACCFAGGIPLGTTAAELTAPGGRPPTIQFLVPKEISDELFNILTQQVTQIFRVSSPLVLQANLHRPGKTTNSNHNNNGT